jgi:hypothetical protein
MNSRKILAICRRLTWVLALIGGFYLWDRYELMRLPSEGCSPVVSLRPGTVLWVDRHAKAASVGDVLFYSLPNGQTAIGRCSKQQESPEAFWVVADNPQCPGQDSDDIGWVPPSRIEGRLLLAF